MRCLFLDLASHHGLLACTDEQKVLAAQEVDHRIGDHELIPLTEKLLADAQWSFPDLTHIACVTGPGGFTSLRVAVSFANVLAHELKIPAAGVHLSDLYFARASHPALRATLSRGERERGEASFLWLHSTKKHELFVRGFGEYTELWPEATHVSVEDFLEKLSSALSLREVPPPPGAPRHPPPVGEGIRRTLFWTGELLPEHQALLDQKGAGATSLRPLQEVLPAFLVRQTYEQKLLEPWYGRAG